MTDNICQREYDFTLILLGIPELTSKVEDALFEAGCDDSTLSMRSGRAYLTFSRYAQSMKDAILSAIDCVRNAGIGADVLRVDGCNLVTQSDIARRIGRSRQTVHQYMIGSRGPGGFPPPACDLTEAAPLWYWCEVAYWLSEHDMIKDHVLQEARDIDIINSVLELQHQKKVAPELTKEVIDFIERFEAKERDLSDSVV